MQTQLVQYVIIQTQSVQATNADREIIFVIIQTLVQELHISKKLQTCGRAEGGVPAKEEIASAALFSIPVCMTVLVCIKHSPSLSSTHCGTSSKWTCFRMEGLSASAKLEIMLRTSLDKLFLRPFGLPTNVFTIPALFFYKTVHVVSKTVDAHHTNVGTTSANQNEL